jgi:hypothetical protein
LVCNRVHPWGLLHSYMPLCQNVPICWNGQTHQEKRKRAVQPEFTTHQMRKTKQTWACTKWKKKAATLTWDQLEP